MSVAAVPKVRVDQTEELQTALALTSLGKLGAFGQKVLY